MRTIGIGLGVLLQLNKKRTQRAGPMHPRRNLYRLATTIELITGVTLLLMPELIIRLLFATDANEVGLSLAQLYGLALVGLGVSSASEPCPRAAQRGLLFYNSFAAVQLFALIAKAISGGLVVWSAACLHLMLGVLMTIDQLQERSN